MESQSASKKDWKKRTNSLGERALRFGKEPFERENCETIWADVARSLPFSWELCEPCLKEKAKECKLSSKKDNLGLGTERPRA